MVTPTPFKLMAKLTRQLKYYFVSSPKNKKIQYGYQNKAGPGNSGLFGSWEAEVG